MGNLTVKDFRPFLPAKDFSASKEFYQKLGCELLYDSDALVLFELGDSRFYIQDYYVKEYADNYMLHVSVEDVDSWYEHIVEVLNFTESNSAPRLTGSPKDEPPPYNARVCYLIDPSGCLFI